MAGDNSKYSRFRIWDTGPIPYDHNELSNNWQELEDVLGVPAAGPAAWPPVLGVKGGIYREIALLQQDRVPIGTVTSWFRPADTVSPPAGWVICDGVGDASPTDGLIHSHDFVGFAGPFTCPDYRNLFIVGANLTNADGNVATSGDAAANAPGLRGTGGSNLGHTHTVPDHYHDHHHTHGYSFTGTTSQASNDTAAEDSNFQGTHINASKQIHVHTFGFTDMTSDARENGSAYGDANLHTQVSKQMIPTSGTAVKPTGGTPGDVLTTANNGSGRPNYVGLLYIVKVKYATTV